MSSFKKGKSLTAGHREKLSKVRKRINGVIEKKFYENPGNEWIQGRLKNEEVKIKYGRFNINKKYSKETLEKFSKRSLKYNYTIKSPEGKNTLQII